jgi:hypothetical protein
VVRATIALGLVALFLATGSPASADPAGLDEVYAKLGVDQVSSDYVVMVDVSASMNGARSTQVRKSLTGFFAALAPEDQVTLIPFAEHAPATTRPVGHAPAQLVAELPKTANGPYTDIGAALQAAVKALGRTGAPPLSTVVLMTDGQHDPGPRSAYPLTQGYSWDQLTASARALHKTSLQAYAIPLAGATGAPLLRKVFPGASVLAPTSVDNLTATLARPKAAARAAKARSLLAAEVGRPIGVQWPATTVAAGRSVEEVRLRSPMPHVPLVIDHLTVQSGNPAVTATVPGTAVQLPPGGTVTIPVTLQWDAGPHSAAPVKAVHDRVNLQLSGQVRSPWSTVVTDDLGLKFDPVLPTTAGDTTLSSQRGSFVYWIVALVVLIALIVLLVRWRRSRLSPALHGTVSIDGGRGESRTVDLSGRRLQLSADVTGLPGSGEITAARDGVGSSEVRLQIAYSPDGSSTSRAEASCPPGQSVTVAGVTFAWRVTVPAQRKPSVPTTR